MLEFELKICSANRSPSSMIPRSGIASPSIISTPRNNTRREALERDTVSGLLFNSARKNTHPGWRQWGCSPTSTPSARLSTWRVSSIQSNLETQIKSRTVSHASELSSLQHVYRRKMRSLSISRESTRWMVVFVPATKTRYSDRADAWILSTRERPAYHHAISKNLRASRKCPLNGEIRTTGRSAIVACPVRRRSTDTRHRGKCKHR
ncbi:hypothetical protein PMAYCL1PPCAC_00999, partial [Pristionchus mayeri]